MMTGIHRVSRAALVILFLTVWGGGSRLHADSISDNPILFVTVVPNPRDFGTMAATFGNHTASPDTAFRGGDLWIRYADGTLKNLTQAAGYGNTGFQGANSIAVRDPAVHWQGSKAVFSMVVGAPTQQYQLTNHRWQLYEITGLGSTDTPVITKIANQPAAYNNHAPVYASDDSIIFVSDRPRDDTVLHTYPQRDEYESSPVNSGLWKLNPTSGALQLLDHAPSGDFNPIVDSFGRVVFTRWDHLQRDQQNVGASMGAFNFASEASTTPTSSAAESFPEARDVDDPDYVPTTNLFTINQFFPWMMNQDGTDLETLNHIGRHEVGLYIERSFNNDPNVVEFYGQYQTGDNQNEFTIFLHIKESPLAPGTYYGTSCQEFGTHAGGGLITLSGAPGVNPDDMLVTHITHPETTGASNSPSSNHSGLYRDPLPLSNGQLIAVHTSETREDTNIGTGTAPISRYQYRLKQLSQGGSYYSAGAAVTSGISKSVSFWSPDQLITYSGTLWEMMPVEVKSRPSPASETLAIPNVEAQVIASLGIGEEELRSYLRSNNLALVVSRNVTSRDRNDRQQPVNLRVPEGVSSLPHSGKVYDVPHMQFYQGDLVRGYSSGNNSGRRVLAQPMHSVQAGINPTLESAPAGSVRIASDGSMAAFVPARRALSWQLVDPDGKPVVRERYWVTFQPGEVRVCASCHGVNSADQLGRTAPTNSPQALAQLLAHWKNLPMPDPTPPGGDPGAEYKLKLRGLPKLRPGSRFRLNVNGGSAGEELRIISTINGKACSSERSITLDDSGSAQVVGRFPKSPLRALFKLRSDGGNSDLARAKANLKSGSLRQASAKALCKKIKLKVES